MADYVSLTNQRLLTVDIPSISEQRAIANKLGVLDDKIELNRRTKELLEAIAQTLFQSWFVDFDPVRAKAEGRDPGLPGHLAELFPDSFEESELGEIPKGWEIRRFGEVASLEYGKGLDDYASGVGEIPVYGTNGEIGRTTAALCQHPGIIIGRKGAYRGVHFCPSAFYAIDTAFYVEAKLPLDLRWAYYNLLRQRIGEMDSGSAIPSTSRDEVYGLVIVFPPAIVQEAFAKAMQPLWDRQQVSSEESRTLAALRDTLLPKLLSGEIRIRDAERMVGRAT